MEGGRKGIKRGNEYRCVRVFGWTGRGCGKVNESLRGEVEEWGDSFAIGFQIEGMI